MSNNEHVPSTFRALAESAERKFARVRDVPLHPYGNSGAHFGHFFRKVFKSYMRLWKYQQENRLKLVESGLQRWEIGEIASRIGQLYFNQYLRTSEARFLFGAYIFYEAIFNRKYFEGSIKDRGVRFKELRFYARFAMVSLILNRGELVKLLVAKLKALVEDSKTNFRDTNFREWKLVMQDTARFLKAESACRSRRPLRYHAIFDSYPASLPYVARFNAKRLLKLHDALLTSYHKNEVKFAELTLDTFRMLQCLEWEPNGSFYQTHPNESRENVTLLADHSLTSGMIDMKLVAEMIDPTLPPNPKKAVLYRPSVTQLLNVISTICEELPLDSVMLIYLSAPGSSGHGSTSQMVSSGNSIKCLKLNPEQNSCLCENHLTVKGDSSHYFDNYLWLGPSRNGGSNVLFPGDIIPFTRRPLFLIVDSDNSHAFKVLTNQRESYDNLASQVLEYVPLVLHGAERGEPAALFLSPLTPSFNKRSGANMAQNGSQFTLFLTTPLQAFCQTVDCNSTDDDSDMYNDAETILSTAFSEWEVILCTSTDLDLVWAQLLSDPFLRRLILRFIFCRAVLALFQESDHQYLPVCLPELPSSLSPNSKAVQPSIKRLANHLNANCFLFRD